MKKEEITLKNTKQEILDALNEALLREKNNAKVKSNPLQEEKERKANEAVKETKKNVENNIFSTELINKFNDLELAIATEEEKLKNLYGIEQELSNLTLVINSGKDLISELEDKKKKESLKIEVELKEQQDAVLPHYLHVMRYHFVPDFVLQEESCGNYGRRTGRYGNVYRCASERDYCSFGGSGSYPDHRWTAVRTSGCSSRFCSPC